MVAGTAAGLAAVLGFHTSAVSGLSTVSAAAPSAAGPTTTTTTGTRRANGQYVQYRYGALQLQVTVSGGRITKVSTVTDQATDPRSAEINSQAIPMLRDQVLQAQSANFDGISGATYTSMAYAQSLQAALDQLGWKK